MTSDTHAQQPQPTDDALQVDWEGLAALPAPDREAQLRRFSAALAALPEPDRLAQLRTVVARTYALSDEAFRAVTAARLRAWLQLDRGEAERVARSYDTVLQELPARDAMRRVAVVQTLMRDLSDDEQRRLRELNPEERARGLVLTNLDSFAESPDAEP